MSDGNAEEPTEELKTNHFLVKFLRDLFMTDSSLSFVPWWFDWSRAAEHRLKPVPLRTKIQFNSQTARHEERQKKD